MPEAGRRTQKPAGPAPTEASLREAALAHLARFAATETGLRRVLERHAMRWAHRAEAEGRDVAADLDRARAAAASIARALASAGAVDDAAFAASRARRLARGGKSRRAIAAHLAAKGVGGETARAALPTGEEAELDAALAALRRRRAGPFALAGPDAAARLKALGALARAGFARDVAERALDLDRNTAETRLLAAKQG